ncbi:MAG: serine/threonine-protein kinase [Planctomycetota bacterium]
MTDDLYQQAKKVFNDLVELPERERDAQLGNLDASSPDLAKEVRSLLEYHTVQSLVVPPSNPKIKTRSTLSTTYQATSWKWAKTPMWVLALGIPVFAAGIGLSLWFHSLIKASLEQSVAQYLDETIDHRLSDFNLWESERIKQAVEWAEDEELASLIQKLIEDTKDFSPDSDQLKSALTESTLAAEIETKLQLLSRSSEVKYAVWDRRMLTICDWNQVEKPELLGAFVTKAGASMLAPVLSGTPKIFFPKLGKSVTEGFSPEGSGPILSVFVPILDPNPESDSVLAALMIRNYGLEEEYASLIKTWTSAHEDAEVYLLNGRGAMLSPSRYQETLDRFQYATTGEDKSSSLLVLDPGVNLEEGVRPSTAVRTWSPTEMAKQVMNGTEGSSTSGYRNYVGIPVVGAWRYIDRHEIGIAFEQKQETAFRVSNLARFGLFALTGIFTLGFVIATSALTVSALSRRKIRDISEVGPYEVQELIGEGGMGRVYLAEHALLCRQSAIKVLTQGVEDLSVIGRFEREVQLASQLTHPNTIAIYDFGRNKDGLFYYAMEYINGAHLGQLLEFDGPIPPGRCIYILQQLCRALFEAHQAGVVHRDIKPQNIMVCNRGGEPDFVKLFDYGLVKSFAPGVSHNSAQTRVVVGTPRFMAPERLNSPWLADPRVDVYSVGALAYYLLTGQLPPLVTMDDGLDNQQTGVETLDLPPDVVDFGELLSVCMAVEPSTRPSNMASLMRELDALREKFPWDREDSNEWWEKNESKLLLMVKNKRKKLTASPSRLIVSPT